MSFVEVDNHFDRYLVTYNTLDLLDKSLEFFLRVLSKLLYWERCSLLANRPL